MLTVMKYQGPVQTLLSFDWPHFEICACQLLQTYRRSLKVRPSYKCENKVAKIVHCLDSGSLSILISVISEILILSILRYAH